MPWHSGWGMVVPKLQGFELSLDGWQGLHCVQSWGQRLPGSSLPGLQYRMLRKVKCKVGLGTGQDMWTRQRTVGFTGKGLTLLDNLALHSCREGSVVPLFWNVFSSDHVTCNRLSWTYKDATADLQTRKQNYLQSPFHVPGSALSTPYIVSFKRSQAKEGHVIHSFIHSWLHIHCVLGTVLGPVDSRMHKILRPGGPTFQIKWVPWPSQGPTLWSWLQ